VFKTPQNDSDAARAIFEDCQKRSITQVAIITAADGFGDAGRKELISNAPNYGVTIVADETYPPDATDLTPILTSIKAKNPQAIVNWSIVEAQGFIAAQMKQIGMTTQLYQSHGFGNKAYITPEAEGVLFPAGRLLVVNDIDASNPQYQVLTTFKQEYETKYGEEVSTFAGHAFDALHMVEAAILAGATDRESIRAGLEATTGFVGTAGIFNMTPTDHCGLGADAFAMLTVNGGVFRLAEAIQPAQ
jgi:branched-chain amino acid transport system substrate-binding protein